tara:strand:+ start:49 stop:363 length:315 start_codon:yes stop_codon:yes gene_type:complete
MKPTEHIFGNSKLSKVKTGDLVRWHTLVKIEPPILPGRARSRGSKIEPSYKENIGIVTNVLVEHRGGRDVAIAKVIPLDPNNSGGTEIEVFLACLKVISESKPR